MQRGIGTEQWEPAPEDEKRDREFTLGPATLLAILCGLLLLCGLFFALGYGAGRHSSSLQGLSVTPQGTADQTATATAGNSLSKPPAKGLVPNTQPSQEAAQTTQPSSLDSAPTGSALTTYQPTESASDLPAAQPQVRAALPSSNATQTADVPAIGSQVQSALSRSAAVMVQIASLSRVEDANVLMNALRKRGYAVVARRESSDNFIHVQVGPFANRSDAVAMSHKLLGDGYNAEVLP